MPFQFLDPSPLVDGDLELVLVRCEPADPERHYVPAYKFRMVRAGTGTTLGQIDLRVGDVRNPNLHYGGHIGYGVEPAYRGHRYAARACRLLLPLARQHGLEEVWITVEPDNLASRRSAELAGGELVEIDDVPEDMELYQEGRLRMCRYRICLDE